MSAQMHDKIWFEGKSYPLAATPLGGYFKQNPDARPVYTSMDSGCARGYVAEWEIRADKLYLTGMEMICRTDSTFASIFPSASTEGVFADWVSALLVCPHGELIRYDHAGFASVYEFELLFSVENGLVMRTEKRKNS